MANTRIPGARPWKVAIYAGMASYLDAGALIASGIVFGALYANEFALEDLTIGLILGLQTLSVAVGAVLGGRLGDRLGRRRVFTFTMLAFAAGVGLLASAPNVPVLFVGAIVTGLAVGADLPVSLAMISETAPEGSKGKMVAFTELLWGLGIATSSLLGALLASLGALGGRLIFLQLLLVAVVVLLLRRTVPESAEWKSAHCIDEVSASARQPRTALRQLFRGPALPALIATGVYYAAWGVGANTLGQFGTYLWVQRADGEVATWSLLSILGLPLAAIGALVFLRYVDTPRRQAWFIAGSLMLVIGWALPAAFGAVPVALIAVAILLKVSTGFSGETIYKVWSQELLPTLVRGTGQGITFAFNRIVAAGFAFATPLLATNNPALLFGIIFGLSVLGFVIGVFWIPRLPLGRDLALSPMKAQA